MNKQALLEKAVDFYRRGAALQKKQYGDAYDPNLDDARLEALSIRMTEQEAFPLDVILRAVQDVEESKSPEWFSCFGETLREAHTRYDAIRSSYAEGVTRSEKACSKFIEDYMAEHGKSIIPKEVLDGRLAYTMRLRGDSDKKIYAFFAAGGTELEEGYANALLEAARIVARNRDKAFLLRLCTSLHDAAAEEYVTRAFAPLEEGEGLDELQEREVIRGMLLDGYDKDALRLALLTCSPVLAEFGRGEGYADYLLDMAELELERDQDLLDNYPVILRSDMEQDMEGEYEYQRRNMENLVRRSPSSKVDNKKIDEKLARAFSSAGFQSKNIRRVLEDNRPQDWESLHPREPYGEAVLRSLQETRTQDVPLVRTR